MYKITIEFEFDEFNDFNDFDDLQNFQDALKTWYRDPLYRQYDLSGQVTKFKLSRVIGGICRNWLRMHKEEHKRVEK